MNQDQKDGAKLFEDFVKEPDNQRQVLSYHFRPGNPDVPVGDPITAANGVDPNQPQTLLEVPKPEVLTTLLDKWATQRKKAKVLFVLDVSGSMGEDVGNGQTRLDLAKQASIDALDLFSPDDEVALRIFSNGLGDNEDQDSLDLLPYGRVADQKERLRSAISGLFPTNGTPLYDVADSSYQKALDEFDPDAHQRGDPPHRRQNDDGNPDDDDQQLQSLLSKLRSGGEGQATKPVRVFTIAYSADAGRDVLRQIAEAAKLGVVQRERSEVDQLGPQRRGVELLMAYDQIRVERRGEVALVTLDRPERLNAWTPHMAEELADAFGAANDDPASAPS